MWGYNSLDEGDEADEDMYSSSEIILIYNIKLKENYFVFIHWGSNSEPITCLSDLCLYHLNHLDTYKNRYEITQDAVAQRLVHYLFSPNWNFLVL